MARPLLGVVDRQRDLAHPQGLAAARPGEDHVLHAVAADGAGALLAQNPADRLHDVGLAAAVGPDDPRDPGADGDLRPVVEGLEAEDVEVGQTQAGGSPRRRRGQREEGGGGEGGQPLHNGEQHRKDTIMLASRSRQRRAGFPDYKSRTESSGGSSSRPMEMTCSSLISRRPAKPPSTSCQWPMPASPRRQHR